MVNELLSKFAALLAREKRRFDRTLGEDLRQLKGKHGSGSYTALLMQQRYEADIEDRLSTLLATLKRLLASAPAHEIRDNKSEIDRLAQVWLQLHIEDCQRHLNEHIARIGSVDPGQYDLGRDRFLDALVVELDILNTTARSVAARAETFGDPERFDEVTSVSSSAKATSEGSGTNKVISVFISHSHQDAGLVQRLIALLRSALNLPSSQIRATSVDGFRLPGGSNTTEQLRLEVQSAKVLVGIISLASLKSAYVTFELGARWGSGKPMVPLLAPDVSSDLLAGPLQGINALSCRSSAQLHQFVEDMAEHLSLVLDRPAAYQRYVDDIVESKPGLASASDGGSARQASS